MPVRVVDASALAALLLEEPAREAVVRELEGYDLVAPDLLPYELANAAWKAAQRAPELGDALAEGLATLLEAPILYVSVPAHGAYRLARQATTTVYDAAYLWLARDLNVGLVTLDGRMAALATELRRDTHGA